MNKKLDIIAELFVHRIKFWQEQERLTRIRYRVPSDLVPDVIAMYEALAARAGITAGVFYKAFDDLFFSEPKQLTEIVAEFLENRQW